MAKKQYYIWYPPYSPEDESTPLRSNPVLYPLIIEAGADPIQVGLLGPMLPLAAVLYTGKFKFSQASSSVVGSIFPITIPYWTFLPDEWNRVRNVEAIIILSPLYHAR